MSAKFDPYHKWLGIPPKDQPPHHYRLLGIELFEEDGDVIAAAADRVMSYLKGLGIGERQQESQQLLNEVSRARVCLLNPEKKAAYDQQLRTKLAGAGSSMNLPPVAARPAPGPAPAVPRPREAVPLADPVTAARPPLPAAAPPPAAPAPPREANLHIQTDDPLAKYRRKRMPWYVPAGIALGLIAMVAAGAAFMGPFGEQDSDELVAQTVENEGENASEDAPPETTPSEEETTEPEEPETAPVEPAPKEEPGTEPTTTSPSDPPKEEPAPTDPTDPPPAEQPPESINLFDSLTPKQDSLVGEWQFELDSLVSPQNDYALLLIPHQPPEEYELKAVVSRASGDSLLALGLVAAGSQFVVALDAYGGTISGIDRVDGADVRQNETTRQQSLFTNDLPQTIICTVRKNNLVVTCNDETVLAYQGDFGRLSVGPQWQIREKSALFLGTWRSSFRIRELKLTPLKSSEPTLETPGERQPHALAVRQPPPESGSLQKSVQTVREIFADELARAQSPMQKLALARKFIKQAKETVEDPGGQYALLSEARDLGSSIGHVEVAWEAIDEMEQHFQLPSDHLLQQKSDVLSAANRLARTLQANRVLAGKYLELINEAVQKENYDRAEGLMKFTIVVARKTQDRDFVAEMQTLSKSINLLKKQSERIADSRQRLETDPYDPFACEQVGRFLCFHKGEWEHGLPLMAAGSDERLAGIAKRDLSEPEEAAAQVELADAWWEFAAEFLPEAARPQAQHRAGIWYSNALPSLTGLSKTHVEKRLKEIVHLGVLGSSARGPRPKIPVGVIRTITLNYGLDQAIFLPNNRHALFLRNRLDYFSLWDLVANRELLRFEGHPRGVAALALSANGRTAVSVDYVKKVGPRLHLWDVPSGRLRARYPGPATRDYLTNLSLSADGRKLFFRTGETLRVWDMETGKELRSFPLVVEETPYGIAYSPDHKYLVLATELSLSLWNLQQGTRIRMLDSFPAEIVSAISISPNGRTLAAAFSRDDSPIRLWDVTTGKMLRDLKGHGGVVRGLKFIPGGDQLVSAGDDGFVRVWNVEAGVQSREFPAGQQISHLSLSPSGYVALTAPEDRPARVILWGLP